MSDATSPGRNGIRVDLQYIADMIEPRTRVLDIGCGDGALLSYLSEFKQVDARGIELSMAGVNECVSDGLSVIQGDADTDLDDYPDGAFDYAVLSQTLQATRHPRRVVENLVRIGRHAILSLPNFGHWKVRLGLLAFGRMMRNNGSTLHLDKGGSYEYTSPASPRVHPIRPSDRLGFRPPAPGRDRRSAG